MRLGIRLLVMLLIAGVVFGGVFGFDAFRGKMIAHYMAAYANPPQTVSTTVVQATPWQDSIEAVGSVRAMNGADLASDTSGIVDAINFKSGDDVAAGAVLLRLRGEDDAARLRQLQTSVTLAEANYQRDVVQLRAQAVSRAAMDTDLSALHSAQAAIAQQQATIAKKTIVAPFAGHLGIREVDVGQYVAAGTAIVTLQALDPVYADFYVPQQVLSQMKLGDAVRLSVDTYPGRVFGGTIEAVNARVDPGSRTVQVRARVGNADHALLPGMFATVQVEQGMAHPLLTLPQTAITYNPYGSTVYVVRQQGQAAVASQVFVTVGATRGDQVAVLKGLQAGDTVVVAGQTKLHNGTVIKVNNAVLPSDEAQPTRLPQE